MRNALPFALAAAAVTLAALTAGCSRDHAPIERKLDELGKQIAAVDAKLNALGAGGARAQRPRRPEPDPRDVYAVPIEGAASVGPADALVTIVEGYEYACPACQAARATVAKLREKYGDKLRVVYKAYLVHEDVATQPSIAACAATAQGKFAEMDQLLWDKGFAGGRDFSPAKLEAFATEAGLDLARFKADLAGPCRERVARDHAELASLGQGATPTFYINGRYLVGAGSVAKFSTLIDEELARAEERVRAGTAAADYYRTWVLEKGLKRFEPKAAS